MDFLDLLTVKDEEVFSGTYYERRPLTRQDSGIKFDYDMTSYNSRVFAKIIDDIEATSQTCAIKTDDDLKFKINGYVKTQDGFLWQIQEVQTHFNTPENKQALRLIKQTIQTNFYIRLIKVENPYEL